MPNPSELERQAQDKPEEIWAGYCRVDRGHGDYYDEFYWYPTCRKDITHYIRADIHEAKLARLEAIMEAHGIKVEDMK